MWEKVIEHRSAKNMKEKSLRRASPLTMSKYILFRYVEHKCQNNLWLQLIYYTSTSYTSHISWKYYLERLMEDKSTRR